MCSKNHQESTPVNATATTQPTPAFTPEWIAAQLNDLIADTREYVRDGAARLLSAITPELTEAAAIDAQVDNPADEENVEEEDEPL
jgi:hypothetical protein